MEGLSGSELRLVGGGGDERSEWVKLGGKGRSRRDFIFGTLVRGEKGGEDGELIGEGEGEGGGGRGVGGRFEGGTWMSAAVILGSLDSTYC